MPERRSASGIAGEAVLATISSEGKEANVTAS